MNPESPRTPREELEARLTALLLGELSAEEAAAVRRAIEQDANLAQLHERLKHTIELVRETVASPAEPAAAPAAPLKLSDERRQKLLAHFKTVAPRELAMPRRSISSWLVPLAATAAMVILLAAITAPNFVRSRKTAQSNSIINNLRQLDGAEQQWALEHGKSVGDIPTLEDIKPYLGRGSSGDLPPSVSGETYVLGPVGGSPTAELNRGGRVQKLSLAQGAQLVFVPAQSPAAAHLNGRIQTGGVYSINTAGYINVAPQPSAQFTTTATGPLPPAEVAPANVALRSPEPVLATPFAQIVLPSPEPAAMAGSVNSYNDATGTRFGGGFGGGGGGVGMGGGGGSAGQASASAFRLNDEYNQTHNIPRDDVAGLSYSDLAAPDRSASVGSVTAQGVRAPAPEAAPAVQDQNSTFVAAGLPRTVLSNTLMSLSWPSDRTGWKLQVQTNTLAVDIKSSGSNWFDVPGLVRSGAGNLVESPAAVPPPAPVQLALADGSGNDGGAAGRRGGGGGGGRGGRGGGRSAAPLEVAPLPAAQAAATVDVGARVVSSGITNAFLSGNFAEQAAASTLEAPGGSPTVFYKLGTGKWTWTGTNSFQGRLTISNGPVQIGDGTALGDGTVGFGTLITNQSGLVLNRYDGLVMTNATWPAVANATQLDQDNAEKTRPYIEKKLELANLEKLHENLQLKITGENIDLKLPKTTMVEIADRAVPAKPVENPSLWQKMGEMFSGGYTSTARIKVKQDTADIQGMAGSQFAAGYDPYFIQTEFEAIQSEAVLGKAVDALKLNDAWAKEHGGQTLNKGDAIRVLKKSLDLRPVRNTSFVEIRAKSDQPEEAARIANAVADAYRDYRLDQRRELSMGGIRVLEQDYQAQANKIRTVMEEADRLRKELNIADYQAAGASPTPLLESENLRRLEIQRIESETHYVSGSNQLALLSPLSKEQLRKVLPNLRDVLPDPMLNELLGQLNLAEQKLLAVKNDFAPDNPQYIRAKDQVDALNKKVDGRIEGVMISITNQVAKSKAEVDRFKSIVTDAMKADQDKAEKSRPYFDKKMELENLQKLHDILQMQITAEKSTVAKQAVEADLPARRAATNAPIPPPEIQTADNTFSTFSLNVSDVSFKLAAASLEKGQMPDPASVRSEEFINAFDYRDPEPPAGVPIGFAWERARYPFAHNRDLLRFSLKTAAAGRQAGRPLNIVLLLDNSGSMERADRVSIIREALRVLASELQPQDKFSVITFARTARLFADGVSGDKASEVTEQVSGLTPQGGTNLEDAMNLAYQTAARHYLANGINRVVLMTDGAANLGDVEPESLKQKVEAQRKQGIALDCFGIGWEGFNDDLLEVLSRNGDGRYGFINSPDEAAIEFATQLAGALKVAASDVKVQVEFNPKRVTSYRQIGYAKHQLTKEQFRDNTVDAAEIAAQEAGNALYTVEVNPAGAGPLCTVRVRFKIPGTTDYREQAWDVPFTGNALSLEQSSSAMRLAASASAFSEWLVASPFAGEVTPDRVLGYLSGVPDIYGADARPKKLEWMVRQAKSIEGK